MNKNGWGLRVELMFILLFLICLVMATIGLNQLGLLGNENVPVKPSIESGSGFSYTTLENKLTEGAKKYFDDYYNHTITEDMIVVRSSTLTNGGYMTRIYDGNGKECSGYVKIINAGSGIIYKSYVKCPKYSTSGYDKSNDW